MVNFFRLIVLSILFFACFSCKNDGNVYIPFQGGVETYPLTIQSNPSRIYGGVTFTELEDSLTLVNVLFDSLQNPIHQPYPVALLRNNFIDGSEIVAYLNPIEKDKVSSKLILSQIENQSIFFAQLLNYDGHIKVFSSDSLHVLYQTDIGQNALTNNAQVYHVQEQNGFLLSGNVNFAERKNGETQALLRLSNTVSGQEYKLFLFGGSIEQPTQDTIAFLGHFQANESNYYLINIPVEKNGTVLKYENLLKLDAHLAFMLKNNLVSAANIGINAK